MGCHLDPCQCECVADPRARWACGPCRGQAQASVGRCYNGQQLGAHVVPLWNSGMIDIGKQVSLWREGAVEDWEVAQHLVDSGRVRHGLFFGHLALEKALKAHVCRHTSDLAPRLHNLVRLAELAGLDLSEEQTGVLAEMNPHNIEGRYPDRLGPVPSRAESRQCLSRAKEVYEWLRAQFSDPCANT